VDKVEKVNGYRKMVAHHQVLVNDGKLILHSAQARKLLKRIKDFKPMPAKTVDDIHEWIEAARGAYGQGQSVLANLDRFAQVAAKRRAK
jgi:Fe-S cluster biosynthesis and repair protein YggX